MIEPGVERRQHLFLLGLVEDLVRQPRPLAGGQHASLRGGGKSRRAGWRHTTVGAGPHQQRRQLPTVGHCLDLLAGFKLQTPNWLSWYKQDDRYSREELSGDIEKLRSYYLDRGYANMDVETTQVAITPTL